MQKTLKLTWLAGLLMATTWMAVPASAKKATTQITGKLFLSGTYHYNKDSKEKTTSLPLPLSLDGTLGFQHTLVDDNLDLHVKLGLGDSVNLEKNFQAKALQEEQDQNTSGGILERGNKSPYIQQVYLDYGRLRMGLATNNLSDLKSMPATLSRGFASMGNSAVPQVRWQFEPLAGLSVAVAGEVAKDMQEELMIERINLKLKKQKVEMKGLILPDFVVSAHYDLENLGYVRGALLLQDRKKEKGTNYQFMHSINVSTKLDVVPDSTALKVQAGFNSGTPEKPNTKMVDTFSGAVGVEHTWAPNWSSTLAYSMKDSDWKAGQGAFNIMYHFTERLVLGGEYTCTKCFEENDRRHHFTTKLSLEL